MSKWHLGDSAAGSVVNFYFEDDLVGDKSEDHVGIKIDEFDAYLVVMEEIATAYEKLKSKKVNLRGKQLVLFQIFNNKRALVSDWETPFQVYTDCKISDKNFKFIVKVSNIETRVGKIGAVLTEQMANRGQYSKRKKTGPEDRKQMLLKQQEEQEELARQQAAQTEAERKKKQEREEAERKEKEEEEALRQKILQQEEEERKAREIEEAEKRKREKEEEERLAQEAAIERERLEKIRLEEEAAAAAKAAEEKARMTQEEREKREELEREEAARKAKEEEIRIAKEKEEERVRLEKQEQERKEREEKEAIAKKEREEREAQERLIREKEAKEEHERREKEEQERQEALKKQQQEEQDQLAAQQQKVSTPRPNALKERRTSRAPSAGSNSGAIVSSSASSSSSSSSSSALQLTSQSPPEILFVSLLSAARSSIFKVGMKKLQEITQAEANNNTAQIHILGSDSRMKLVNEIKRSATYPKNVAECYKRVIYRFCVAYLQILLKYCVDLPAEKCPVTDANRNDILDIIEDDEEGSESFVDIAPLAIKLWEDEKIKQVYYSMKAELFRDPSVDPGKHFFDSLARLNAPDYVPTQDDIVMLPTFTSEYSVWTQDIVYIKSTGKGGKTKMPIPQRYIDCGSILPTMQYGLFRDMPVTVFVFWIDLMEYRDDAPIKAEGEQPEKVLRKTLGLFRTVFKYQMSKNTKLERPVIAFVVFDNVKMFFVKIAQNPDALKHVFPNFNPSAVKNKAEMGRAALDHIKKEIAEHYIAGCNIAFHETVFMQDAFRDIANFASDVFQNDQLMERLAAQFG